MKVLFIAFYFPPYSVSTPVTRAVELVKNLATLGVKPYVLTQEGFVFGEKDYSFENDVKNIPIFRVKMPGVRKRYGEKSSIQKILRNLLWPDSASLFIKRALPVAMRIIKNHRIDLVFSFSPPYSSLFLTYLIHKKTGLPYGIDMQDPWKENLYNLYRNRFQKTLSNYYERKVLKNASFITAINVPMITMYRSEYGLKNVYFLPFGYRIQDVSRIKDFQKGEKLRFLYAGTLGGDYKNPEHLFSAIDLFFSKHYGAKVEFYFVGNKTPEVKKRLSEFPNDEVVSIPYVEKKEIPELINRAHVLLLLSTKGKHSHLVSTSKVYELLNMKRPLAAFLEEGWLYDLVKKHTPFITKWDDTVGMAQIFENLYELWKNDKLYEYSLMPQKEYSYPYLAERLFEIIKKHV